jgi:hypothetical protein
MAAAAHSYRDLRGALLAALAGVCLVVCALSGSGQPTAAAAERAQPSEYEVKAAFLLNFVKFVTWPHSEPNERHEPVSICIAGENPFGETLDLILRGESVDGRRITAVKLDGRRPSSCSVLFVAKSEREPAKLLAEAGVRVLTVGEEQSFLDQGGMIAFVVENRRVRFDINQRAVAKTSLRISSRMLAVARVVRQ